MKASIKIDIENLEQKFLYLGDKLSTPMTNPEGYEAFYIYIKNCCYAASKAELLPQYEMPRLIDTNTPYV